MATGSNVVRRENIGMLRNRLIEVNNAKVAMGTLEVRVKNSGRRNRIRTGETTVKMKSKCIVASNYTAQAWLEMTWKGEKRRSVNKYFRKVDKPASGGHKIHIQVLQ